MLSVIYCTRKTNPEYKEHLIKSSGLNKSIEVIEIINNGESLTTAYNRGLKQAKNDILVFSHDDISIETKNWGVKLLKLFNKNPEYGIIGVAGTKQLPSSGKWWETPKKMYGKVAHTHEGKTWLSSYSDDLNQSIEETVVVDGVFYAINKTKIKKEFNESVLGFHFYDVTFCFENYLEGVKIGVTTLIRINHKSIGQTNEQWEENRIIFSETFKDKLPVNIKKKLRKGEILKIMFTSLSFNDYTEKSKTILEIAKKLKKNGHDITLCSNMDGSLPMIAKRSGISLAPIQQPPNFLLGDGKWTMNTSSGPTPSQKNVLYKMKDKKFDIIHIFDDELITHMKKLYGDTILVNTKFSDNLFVNDEENELVSTSITLSTDFNNNKNIEVSDILNKYIDVI